MMGLRSPEIFFILFYSGDLFTCEFFYKRSTINYYTVLQLRRAPSQNSTECSYRSV